MTSVLPPSASPATSTQTPSQPEAAPAGDGRKARYALIFGIASAALTLVAVVLAVVAPLFSPVAGPLSDGWKKVYDSNSQPFSATAWDESNGCSVTPDGLHAGSRAHCTFKPSQGLNLTGNGFVIDVTVAPPGAVASEQIPVMYITDSVFVGIDQSGSYALCVRTCDTSDPEASNGIAVTGQADDWHAATNVSNTIAVRVTSVGIKNTLQFFTNGQYTASIELSGVSLYTATIALGADDAGEALFTSAAIYSASA
jgi:hypothetical protein